MSDQRPEIWRTGSPQTQENRGSELIGTQLSDSSQIDMLARFPEQADRSLVYVDYVEVAPWNLKTLMVALGEKPFYSPIGSRAEGWRQDLRRKVSLIRSTPTEMRGMGFTAWMTVWIASN
jgi:hypothetical protein